MTSNEFFFAKLIRAINYTSKMNFDLHKYLTKQAGVMQIKIVRKYNMIIIIIIICCYIV